MRTLDRKPTANSRIIFDPMMTQDKFDELEDKLSQLMERSQPRAAAEVSRLAELGDFSENTEYQMAKGKLRGMNNAILRLSNQIEQAIIIPANLKKDTVQIGSNIVVESDDKQTTYQILGSSQTDPSKGIISHTSPIGSALLGHKTGDVVDIQLVNKIVQYKIVRIF
ncbi:MAG: GreA/GreB family elongation factor [Candidatus Magasanikbacteria bacterium]|jgi:transcription elongation GreA/GreB family factor